MSLFKRGCKIKIYHFFAGFLVLIFGGAYIFGFISQESFFLLICSHISLHFCLYFDKFFKKPKKEYKEKVECYMSLAMAVFFFCFMIGIIFFHNADKKGFGPQIIEKVQEGIGSE